MADRSLKLLHFFSRHAQSSCCSNYISMGFGLEMAWAAKRPANKPLTRLFIGPLNGPVQPFTITGPLTSR